MKPTMKKWILASLLLSTALLAAGSASAASLYFPHVDTTLPWQTEIAIINTSDQTVTGTLKAFKNNGDLVETEAVTLSAHGRRQINVANEFTNNTSIGYIVFESTSDTVQGYTKFYRQGQYGYYRVAVPAIKDINTSAIYVTHIDSGTQWWTGISLVNTTSGTKNITITFNNGQSTTRTINAYAHDAFTIGELFNNQPQPSIKSAVITNASGVIGLELFGTNDGKELEGIPLTDKTASTLYYPNVADRIAWWTGIVAYNPSDLACSITVRPYSAQGSALTTTPRSLVGKEKYVGTVFVDLPLPAQTAWLQIDSTSPLTGFELFGSNDGEMLVGYAGGGGPGAKAGVFPKIEKSGWTNIFFVNTEAYTASVTLTAYDDSGTAVAHRTLLVNGFNQEANSAEAFFTQSIANATYITYSADRNLVGFQVNGSADNKLADGLPALAAPWQSLDVTDCSPITEHVTSRYPTLTATFRSSYGAAIDISSIEMRVDGSLVAPTVIGSGSEIRITYTPTLPLYGYANVVEVTVRARDVNGVIGELTWQFEIPYYYGT